MTGLIGFSSGYHAMKECELLLMLGTEFPYRQFFPDAARMLQIDIDPTHMGRRTPLEFGAVRDIKTTVRALLPLLEPKDDRRHLDHMLEHYPSARSDLDELASAGYLKESVHPQHLARVVAELHFDRRAA